MFAGSKIKFHNNFKYNTLLKKTSQVIEINSIDKKRKDVLKLVLNLIIFE